MATQFGGFVPDSLLPQADCESGPSCSDLRASVGDLGFTSLTGIVRPSVLVAVCVCMCVCVRATMKSCLGVSRDRQQLRFAAPG